MNLQFEIIHLAAHHNRGQFIFARLLDFKAPFVIEEDVLMNEFYVYQYMNMYPFKIEGEADQHDIYVFRPTSLKGFPKDALHRADSRSKLTRLA